MRLGKSNSPSGKSPIIFMSTAGFECLTTTNTPPDRSMSGRSIPSKSFPSSQDLFWCLQLILKASFSATVWTFLPLVNSPNRMIWGSRMWCDLEVCPTPIGVDVEGCYPRCWGESSKSGPCWWYNPDRSCERFFVWYPDERCFMSRKLTEEWQGRRPERSWFFFLMMRPWLLTIRCENLSYAEWPSLILLSSSRSQVRGC